MFRSLEGGIPFFRVYVRAVAKGEMAPLQALERLRLFGLTTRVSQRLFLRQSVHENALTMNERGITLSAEQHLRAASRELAKAFAYLNQNDYPGDY